jgi:hypothetical protein
VDGALKLKRATRHDGKCQCTLSTRLRTRAGSARQWPPRHAFGSGGLSSGVACSRASSPSGWPRNPTGAVPMRADTGGQRRWDATAHRSRCDGSRWQAHTRASSQQRGGDGWPAHRRQFSRRCHAGEQRRGIGRRGS